MENETGTEPAVNADPAQDQQESKQDKPEAPPEKPQPAEQDWKAQARKWEQRAKENAAAAKKLADIEEASKSEQQKQAERLAAAEREAAAAKVEALRYRIATKHNVADEDAELFLTGTDEETLTRQAQRLAERAEPRAPQPNRQQGTPSNPRTGSLESGRERFKASKPGGAST